MKTRKTFVYGLGAIVWFILLISLIVFLPYSIYLLGHTNETRNLVETLSPNKNIAVDNFNIYGGATGSDLTQVVIRPQNQRFDSRRNYCLLSVEGLKETKINWTTDTSIKIQYQPGVVYRAAPRWNDISVTYSELK